jgi:hypothetical protein
MNRNRRRGLQRVVLAFNPYLFPNCPYRRRCRHSTPQIQIVVYMGHSPSYILDLLMAHRCT